jgi:hypothetical protein
MAMKYTLGYKAKEQNNYHYAKKIIDSRFFCLTEPYLNLAKSSNLKFVRFAFYLYHNSLRENNMELTDSHIFNL